MATSLENSDLSPSTLPPPPCWILGSPLSVLNLEETVRYLGQARLQKQGGYVCVTNVHTTVEGWHDPAFRDINKKSFLCTADGVPLVWVSRWIQPAIHGRASGPDILERILEDDSGRLYRHYFYGSTPEVLASMKRRIEKQWPGTQISGMLSPPFRSLSPAEKESIRSSIRDAKPDFVWVGLGAPKQERWMAEESTHLPNMILLGVGAAFDFLAGNKPRAPLWMQKAGLEWAFRLASEPRRLFSRYFKTNSIFVFAVLGQMVKKWFGFKHND